MSPLERVTSAFIPSSLTSTLGWEMGLQRLALGGSGARRGPPSHPSSWMTCCSRGTISSGVRGPKRKRVQRDCSAGMILER